MQNQKTDVRSAIEKAKEHLEILEEIELLDSEFRLIENEYHQRREHLAARLKQFETAETTMSAG